jgi:hypothetical protein
MKRDAGGQPDGAVPVKFDLHWDWCESALHPNRERYPFACVTIGNISICEDCLYRYLNGWEHALSERFLVDEYRRDMHASVRCATRLVLGLEEITST